MGLLAKKPKLELIDGEKAQQVHDEYKKTTFATGRFP